MLFNSLEFIFIFLPFVLLLVYTLQKYDRQKFQNKVISCSVFIILFLVASGSCLVAIFSHNCKLHFLKKFNLQIKAHKKIIFTYWCCI